MQVRMVSWQNGSADHPKPVITGSAEGDSIERVWVEFNKPLRQGDVIRGNWIQLGRPLWKAPYVFSLEQAKLPHGKVALRIAAANIWEEIAYSNPFEVESVLSMQNKVRKYWVKQGTPKMIRLNKTSHSFRSIPVYALIFLLSTLSSLLFAANTSSQNKRNLTG